MKEKKTNWLKDHAGDILSFGGLVLCIILFTLLSKANGNDFWSAYNLKKLIEQVCVYAILAVGAVFIYSMGAMDISVGAQIGVYCITLILIANATGSLLAGFLAVLVLALLCGFFNGYVSVLLGLPSIVTSIFLMSIFSGVQMLLMEKIGSNTVKLISELKAIRNIFKDTSVMLAADYCRRLYAGLLHPHRPMANLEGKMGETAENQRGRKRITHEREIGNRAVLSERFGNCLGLRHPGRNDSRRENPPAVLLHCLHRQ